MKYSWKIQDSYLLCELVDGSDMQAERLYCIFNHTDTKTIILFLWIWSMTLQLIIVAHEVRKTTRNLTLIWQIVRYVRRAGSTYINHSFILRGVQMLFGLYFWGSAVKICHSYLLVSKYRVFHIEMFFFEFTLTGEICKSDLIWK